MRILRASLCLLLALCILLGACAMAEPVTFEDPVIESAIREALGVSQDEPVTTDQLETLTSLRSHENGVTTLNDLAKCKNLEELRLEANAKTKFNLEPLRDLTSLQHLDLDGVVLNIAPVMELPNLRSLSIQGMVGNLDFTPIEGHDSLEIIYLLNRATNTLTDFMPLQSQKSMRTVTLPLREEEVQPLLESWPNLEYFALYSCRVTTDELSTMATRKLRRLQVKLYDDQPADFSWLSEQPDLYWIILFNCNPDDAALASLAKAAPGLEYLEFGGKNITDFTPLQSMQLKRLVIQNVSQKTIDAVQEMLPDVAVASSARVFH